MESYPLSNLVFDNLFSYGEEPWILAFIRDNENIETRIGFQQIV
jgi:hypothetical protein